MPLRISDRPVTSRVHSSNSNSRRHIPGIHTLRSRLSILVAATAAIAAVLGLLVLNTWLTSKIDESVTKDQRARVTRIMDFLRSGNTSIPRSEPFAQVIGRRADGRWFFLSRTVAFEGLDQLLTPAQLQLASTQELLITGKLEALGGQSRLLAVPEQLGTTRVVVVVGSSLAREDDTKHRLAVAFTLAGAVVVALIAGGGWALIGAALRPVRRMADEAAAISGSNLDRRLVLPDRSDEIAHLGATLNGMLERIEGSFRRERAFVDDASHELRTPLTIMRGELELAMAQPGDAEETRAAMQSLLDEVDRLSRLAEDLLVLARSGTTARSELSSGPTELLTVVTRAAGRLGRSNDSGLRLNVSGPPVSVEVPEAVLERIVTNLLINAQHFAAGTISVGVGTVESPAGPLARLVVEDDGPGFPVEFLPRAFERFAVGSQSRTRSHGGTGLGLAIVRELSQTWGGTATAANGTANGAANGAALGGAAVTVTFPIAPGTASQTEAEPLSDPAVRSG